MCRAVWKPYCCNHARFSRISEPVFRALGYIRGCRRVPLSTFPANWSNRQETLGLGVSNAQKPVSTLFSSGSSYHKSKLEISKVRRRFVYATTYLQDNLPPLCNFTGFAAFLTSCRFITELARNISSMCKRILR